MKALSPLINKVNIITFTNKTEQVFLIMCMSTKEFGKQQKLSLQVLNNRPKDYNNLSKEFKRLVKKIARGIF